MPKSKKGLYRPQDDYFKKAKKVGYVARSAFKLEEIDKKYRLYKKGFHVLDLGCAPGSWLQYASSKVGPEGRLWGIDLEPVRVELSNVTTVVGDILKLSSESSEFKDHLPFDVIQSDAMSKTSGVYDADSARSLILAEHGLALAKTECLKKGGAFVCKIFEGPGFHEFYLDLKLTFKKCSVNKPEAIRQGSREVYVVGLDKK